MAETILSPQSKIELLFSVSTLYVTIYTKTFLFNKLPTIPPGNQAYPTFQAYVLIKHIFWMNECLSACMHAMFCQVEELESEKKEL